VNGNQGDNSVTNPGAAYVYKLPDPLWTDLGGGTIGIAGTPSFLGTGSLVGGTLAQLTLTNAPPFAPLLMWVSFASVPVVSTSLGGTMHVFPPALQFLLFADGSGGISIPLTWPVSLPPSTKIWFQMLVVDPTSIPGITLSNGLLATTP
jgi:hypothetical protein